MYSLKQLWSSESWVNELSDARVLNRNYKITLNSFVKCMSNSWPDIISKYILPGPTH